MLPLLTNQYNADLFPIRSQPLPHNSISLAKRLDHFATPKADLGSSHFVYPASNPSFKDQIHAYFLCDKADSHFSSSFSPRRLEVCASKQNAKRSLNPHDSMRILQGEG
jgi:hypothetical protein